MYRVVAFGAGLVAYSLLNSQVALAQEFDCPEGADFPAVFRAKRCSNSKNSTLLSHRLLCIRTTCFRWFSWRRPIPSKSFRPIDFVKENSKLKGEQLKAALDKQSWDESVKSLVATPDVLSMLNSKLDWMVKLGNAVLAQQPDVMDAVQRLRNKADANNKLSSTKEQTVVKRQEGGKQIIAIQPSYPETIYVPYYDPAVVYGAWPYSAYPPYYFGWPGYIPGSLIGVELAFGAGWALGNWGSGGNYWGGDFNWNNNNINLNRPQVNPLAGNNWQHNPAHRHGVRYDNPRVQQRFGNDNRQAGVQDRMDFRGRDGNSVIKPDGGRAGAGQLPAKGDRPSAGQQPSGKGAGAGKGSAKGPSAGQQPASKNAGQKVLRRSQGSAAPCGWRQQQSRTAAEQRTT